MKKHWRDATVVLALAIAVTATTIGISSCSSKSREPFRDAPGSGVVNSTGADSITMPDGFSNLATKCDHGNRIYVAFHGDKNYAAIAIVPQDPTCKG